MRKLWLRKKVLFKVTQPKGDRVRIGTLVRLQVRTRCIDSLLFICPGFEGLRRMESVSVFTSVALQLAQSLAHVDLQ